MFINWLVETELKTQNEQYFENGAACFLTPIFTLYRYSMCFTEGLSIIFLSMTVKKHADSNAMFTL